MGFFGTNKKQLGQQNTKHLKAGFGGVKAAWYKLTNVPYLDIVIVRGRKRIKRIVAKDEGFDMFTVDGLGTFLLPQGDDMQKMIYYGPGVFLFYRHDSQTPGVGRPENMGDVQVPTLPAERLPEEVRSQEYF